MDRAESNPSDAVQRRGPFGRLGRRRMIDLSLGQIRPLVRIAHRVDRPLNLEERIIFDHEFVLLTSGRGAVEIAGRGTPFAAGHLVLIRPYLPHRFATDTAAGSHLAVHFDLAPGVPPNERLAARRPYQVRLPAGLELPTHGRAPVGSPLARRFGDIVDRFAERTEPARLAVSGMLMRIIADLAGQPEAHDTPDPAVDRLGAANVVRLKRAAAFIDAHLDRPLDVDTIADAAGLSPSYFARLFRAWSGRSVMRYVRQQRVHRARQLLADVDLSIKQVAARCGFDDPYHFSRVFREEDGLPPSQYRAALLAGRE
jgi:AraC-like DNA-binding protein